MKNSILLILISMLALSCHVSKNVSEHQNPVNDEYKTLNAFDRDTIAYIKHNFIDNKDAYIGKKLPVLLNDLELKVNDFIFVPAGQVGLINEISLFFSDQRYYGDPVPKEEQFVIFHIEFKEKIKEARLLEVTRKKGEGLHPEQISYLKDCRIKDIAISVYPK